MMSAFSELKIVVMSDLHLEVSHYNKPPQPADILILAGDITVARYFLPHRMDSESRSGRNALLFKEYINFFERVYYVLGNHESYGMNLFESRDVLRNHFGDKIVILDTDMIDHYAGVRFLGCTLWTNFHNDPEKQQYAETEMNDYVTIFNDGLPLKTDDVLSLHKQQWSWLKEQCARDPAVEKVVITHHPITPMHRFPFENGLLAGAFYNDYREEIDQFRNVKLWVSGHTHYPVDFEYRGVRFVSNPRGYKGYEQCARNFDLINQKPLGCSTRVLSE